MPIATIKYKLPEENRDFKIAKNAWKYKYALQEFSNYLRDKDKYSDDKLPEDWHSLRMMFHDIINTSGCPDIHDEEE